MLGGVTAAIALAVTAGYLTGTISPQGSVDQMSVPTSLGFLALTLGVLLAAPSRGRPRR